MAVFWDVALCSVVETECYFRGVYSLLNQETDGPDDEAVSTSEMFVNFYQTTWHKFLKDSHLHTCCCQNLKYNLVSFDGDIL
jgi:hypothetical protein